MDETRSLIGQVQENSLGQVGRAANSYAAMTLLQDYQQKLSPNTQARQRDAMDLLASYLADAGVESSADALYSDITAWQGMTWGLVAGFKRWLEKRGMAIGSINVHLATIRAYSRIAKQADMISAEDYASITIIKGYRQTEGENVDRERERARIGPKKADALILTSEQVSALKRVPPDTPQGRRDRVMLCMLVDQGLRCGELAILPVSALDMQQRQFRLYRPKVALQQTHRLTQDTFQALQRYLELDHPQAELLFGSTIDGTALVGHMSTRAIHKRVKAIGKRIGLPSLGPHDLRHTWATRAARAGTSPFVLQEAGGWKSWQMPRRYTEAQKIANDGLELA